MMSFRNKSTGQIYTKLCETFGFGDSSSKYLLATSANSTIEVNEEELNRDFEFINITSEYEKVWPMIKKYGASNYEVQRLFAAFLRRLQEGYYNVGDFVVLLDLPGGVKDVDRHYIYDYDPVIYVISRIEPGHDSYRGQYGNKLTVARPKSGEEKSYDMFEFPMFPDRIVQGDAFTCVRRLDMPF